MYHTQHSTSHSAQHTVHSTAHSTQHSLLNLLNQVSSYHIVVSFTPVTVDEVTVPPFTPFTLTPVLLVEEVPSSWLRRTVTSAVVSVFRARPRRRREASPHDSISRTVRTSQSDVGALLFNQFISSQRDVFRLAKRSY